MKLQKLILKHLIPLIICSTFFVAYLLLSHTKHDHFLSGYDLAIIDQATWKYAHFKNPITTSHAFFDTSIYADHLELVFILIAPFYWIFDTVSVLITLQVLSIVLSGVAVYLIAGYYKVTNFVKYCILFSYLLFFGFQFSIWSDVHSLLFGVGFMSWFLYFLLIKKIKLSLLFLLLAITSKEDIGFLTFIISISFYLVYRNKFSLVCALISFLYTCFVFFVYFPNVGPDGYRFANPEGLFSDLNPYYLINTADKQKSILYSLGWFGFAPLLSPFLLLPFVGDLAHYFIVGNGITRTEGLFLHYRSTVALFLVWPTIFAISKFKMLNRWYFGVYLVIPVLFFQYYLHLPVSYLTKQWFWKEEEEVKNLKLMLKNIPESSSIVTQNNITPHLAHRDYIYTLFPSEKDFENKSPCGEKSCKWFRVGGSPELLLVDYGKGWNVLHLLSSREEFYEGISNLERNGNIVIMKSIGTSKLYRIVNKI